MNKQSTMETLIELATEEVEKATLRLGQSIRTATDAEQKLAMLIQYREDYQARFQESQQTGLTASGLRNFRLFMDRLDQAIIGQQQIVNNAQKRIDEDKSNWQASERKRVSFDTLATRAQKAAQKKEDKIEQKKMDEFASRALRYKQ